MGNSCFACLKAEPQPNTNQTDPVSQKISSENKLGEFTCLAFETVATMKKIYSSISMWNDADDKIFPETDELLTTLQSSRINNFDSINGRKSLGVNGNCGLVDDKQTVQSGEKRELCDDDSKLIKPVF